MSINNFDIHYKVYQVEKRNEGHITGHSFCFCVMLNTRYIVLFFQQWILRYEEIVSLL